MFLKEFFKKVDFEKNPQTAKKHAKLTCMQREYIQVIIQELLWREILKKNNPVYKGAARSPMAWMEGSNGENLCNSSNSTKGHNS